MEKAAEVYTRLKSRVLGPKIEAIQKAARTGAEKERAEAEKAEEALGGEEAPSERAEDEASAGEELGGASRAPRPRWGGRRGPLVFSGRPGSVPKASGAWCTHTRALPGGSALRAGQTQRSGVHRLGVRELSRGAQALGCTWGATAGPRGGRGHLWQRQWPLGTGGCSFLLGPPGPDDRYLEQPLRLASGWLG